MSLLPNSRYADENLRYETVKLTFHDVTPNMSGRHRTNTEQRELHAEGFEESGESVFEPYRVIRRAHRLRLQLLDLITPLTMMPNMIRDSMHNDLEQDGMKL